eukprot:CAMPEP_0198264548 /NCGR_PEP_ID=MMETSP1447-20131203/16215_1 /TAXON_ID=420782 /ORGANISM="Chaetoceros dichaeta, Strain CCMP1751" /LENGTH=104 /DNA_ID=CAMNT_0043953525 /DNA_START=20 /DNA_END=334 /DNA_ORIENTATION=+
MMWTSLIASFVITLFLTITPSPYAVDAFVLICPLAPLAPVWVAGKAAIMTRKKFFPTTQPWPREWEKNDIWLEKDRNDDRGDVIPQSKADDSPPITCPASKASK